MKIKPEHYEYMRAAIRKIATPEKIRMHRAVIVGEGKAQDVEKRLRWDLSYDAGLTPWICENIYSYADDDHIDTALRSIMRELLSDAP